MRLLLYLLPLFFIDAAKPKKKPNPDPKRNLPIPPASAPLSISVPPEKPNDKPTPPPSLDPPAPPNPPPSPDPPPPSDPQPNPSPPPKPDEDNSQCKCPEACPCRNKPPTNTIDTTLLLKENACILSCNANPKAANDVAKLMQCHTRCEKESSP
ncbi:hypothetical protein DSO57_1023234 [Entomophthora muscae]|uniref:Uncharacterized protein n=2 Tax=Entomophthora muscae TaxID=34485 RepID=A0ACC2RSC9_9FUNG|nr:hypothetical protein DSO57_1029258 [Entomophthora muscae]KAJ9088426.1 hypothetical protein DSO57_1023234 [Entomophthora muscae]